MDSLDFLHFFTFWQDKIKKMELAGSVEDALKGLEKVHMTIPKPPVKISETKNPRKSKIFKGESYKVKKYQKNKKKYKI